jgi:hypothetical protein
MYWVHDPEPLSGKAGMHRFIWDLHYPFPADVHRTFFGPSAPTASPGTYTVKLSAGGKTYTQALTVKMDPRVKTSQADLEKMFQAESVIVRNFSELSTAFRQAQELAANIAARKKQTTGDSKISQALSELEHKATEVLGPEAEPDFDIFGLTLPPTSSVTIRAAITAENGLLFAVQGSDSAPTADASVAIDKWDSVTKDLLERWKTFWNQDRQRVNSLLQSTNLKPL